VTTVKERTGTVGYIYDSALRNKWPVDVHHTASPVGVSFLSSIAFQVRHLVELLQEFLSPVSTDWSHIIKRTLV
jgi:hypothetical protein